MGVARQSDLHACFNYIVALLRSKHSQNFEKVTWHSKTHAPMHDAATPASYDMFVGVIGRPSTAPAPIGAALVLGSGSEISSTVSRAS